MQALHYWKPVNTQTEDIPAMNPLKTLRVLIAVIFLFQGTIVPAQNVVPVESFNTRDTRPESSQAPSATITHESVVAHQNQNLVDWLENLPGDAEKYLERVTLKLRSLKLGDEKVAEYAPRISKYLGFLMYNSKKPVAEQEKILFGEKSGEGVLNRLLESSTEFLFCKNPNDFKCLEQVPRITPTAKHRVEDPALKLGEMEMIDDTFLDKIKVLFNKQLLIPENQYDPKKGVARELEKLIQDVKPGPKNGIYMALYGIDDIQIKKDESGSTTGSMNGIYSSLVNQVKNQVPVYGVFDTNSAHPNAPNEKLILSYQKPKKQTEVDRWVFTPLKNPQTDASGKVTTGFTNMDFMYNVGTQNLIHAINAGAKNYEESTARLESPDRKIMHNKFFIFNNGGELTVWTGTTNIARTCLGTERNSNLSVVIRENNIGRIYMNEFREMYDYSQLEPKKPTEKFVGTEDGKYPVGKFKLDKSPNTKRLLYFKGDQTVVRIYFSPTDDGEHRAVLPMLHSAVAGDQIIISMFGATGIEYVRALQLAAARGVDVKIIVDSPTACGTNAWIGLKAQASLLEDNPFQKYYPQTFKEPSIAFNNKAKGEVWKQNHQKIGLLMRKQTDGTLKPEHFIFGSQNWSEGGNDESDENMMAISRRDGDLPIGSEFASHFEWLKTAGKAIPVIKAGCEASTKAYEEAEKKKKAN